MSFATDNINVNKRESQFIHRVKIVERNFILYQWIDNSEHVQF